MKLVHLSDLHIGKRLHEYSLIEDQRYILDCILNVIEEENADGVIIAGDVYDKSVPSEEAVALFDNFLVRLAESKRQTFIISGNHDSAERLSFAGRIIDEAGIHIAEVYNGKTNPYTLTDEFGEVCIYMLPFIKPATVRRFFQDVEISSYTDGVDEAVKNMGIDKSKRNVLVTHQFVTGALRSESEEISVGGTDNVDASVFDGFDYVALGHIHKPQNVGSDSIRYCGTPLKYSVSEAKDKKSVTIIELEEKGSMTVRTIPLCPMRDVVELKGTYLELTDKSFYDGSTYDSDYVYITLTDEDDIVDAATRLGVIYKNLLGIRYDNTRTRTNTEVKTDASAELKSPLELFGEFYELRNNVPMNDEQNEYLKELIEEVWEGEL